MIETHRSELAWQLMRECPYIVNGLRAAGFDVFTEEDSMKYKIALHRDEEGVSVSVPGLPGCWSQGATEAEAIVNVQDAIHEYLTARDDLLRDAEIREVEISG